MANLYVRSTDGNNVDSGATWALAKATIAGAMAIDGAGDVTYISQAHSESTAADVTLTCAGTNISPSRIVCGNDAAEPPTALAATGVMTTTGASDITLTGSLYCYGVTFNCGTGSGARADITLGTTGDIQYYENCAFNIVNSAASSGLHPAYGQNGSAEFINCTMKFAAVSQGMSVANKMRWNGGSVTAGSATPTVFLYVYQAVTSQLGHGPILIENFDMSNFASTLVLTIAPPPRNPVTFRNCKLPAAWSGTLLSGTFSLPGRVSMYNCDSGATNYRLWIEDYMGTVRDETTIVRTGGASDGVTPLAWKMSGGARNVYPHQYLGADEIAIYNTTTGAAKTLTIEGIHDSVTNLKNDAVWLEVNYLSAAGQPLGAMVSTRCAVLTTASDLTASTATWTTTGLVNPNKWKIAASVTPQMKGYFMVRVCCVAAGATIYIDPKITIS